MNALDVAAFIIERTGSISAMKLQKLVYYCQAWSLAWTGAPLFSNRIEAWEKGPVVRDLYAAHRGQFEVDTVPGNAVALSSDARRIVDAVLKTYNAFSPDALSDLTHSEAPWMDARTDVAPGARSNAEITQRAMRSYYSWLAKQ